MKSSGAAKSVIWSIGELAGRFGLETHVLRHWESEGLLEPERDSGGRRRYGEADAYRVATIVASKAAGMRLDQIRAMLDGASRDRHRILEYDRHHMFGVVLAVEMLFLAEIGPIGNRRAACAGK